MKSSELQETSQSSKTQIQKEQALKNINLDILEHLMMDKQIEDLPQELQTVRKVTVADIFPFAVNTGPQIDSVSNLSLYANGEEEELFKLKEEMVKTLVVGFGLVL